MKPVLPVETRVPGDPPTPLCGLWPTGRGCVCSAPLFGPSSCSTSHCPAPHTAWGSTSILQVGGRSPEKLSASDGNWNTRPGRAPVSRASSQAQESREKRGGEGPQPSDTLGKCTAQRSSGFSLMGLRRALGGPTFTSKRESGLAFPRLGSQVSSHKASPGAPASRDTF